MRLTNRDKSNLVRFGCTFLAKQNVICIDWKKERDYLSANLAARISYFESASGPVFCLAFEVSPTKALAHYCYFPFDLSNQTHRQYLSDIFKRGKIRLRFLADSGQVERTYEILPSRCEEMAGTFAAAIGSLGNSPAAKYDFDRAVAEFEQKIRIVHYFQYAISESDLQTLVASAKVQAENAPFEERAQAAKIVDELLGVFQFRYDAYLGNYLPQLPAYCQVLSDLHVAFRGNSAGFAEFLADLILAYTPREECQQLEKWPQLLDVVFRFVDTSRKSLTESNGVSGLQAQPGLPEVGKVTEDGKDLSVRALKNLFSAFGVQVGGRPGRPAKDYSTEYELRAKGKKWREVAEYYLQNDSDAQQEFGARKFAELTREQRSILMHRVREGIRGFAKRTNKPFPPKKNTALSLRSHREQENPT